MVNAIRSAKDLLAAMKAAKAIEQMRSRISARALGKLRVWNNRPDYRGHRTPKGDIPVRRVMPFSRRELNSLIVSQERYSGSAYGRLLEGVLYEMGLK